MCKNVKSSLSRQLLWILGVLMAASILSTCLMVFRCAYSFSLTHCYLVWNLFLAWIPVGFSLLAWQHKDSRKKLFLFACLWLLFFPNAPYLVTDLVHLRARPPIPFWFDVVLMQSFIWLGL